MHPGYEFTVMLVIRHPDVDPHLLSRELGLEPEYSWRAGDPRHSGAGGEAHGRYRETYWAAKLYPYPDASAVPTRDALLEAFGTSRGVLLPVPLHSVLAIGALALKRRRTLWERLRGEGASGEFLVSLATRDRFNLTLPVDLVTTLASLHLSLSVDVAYCAAQAAA